MKLTDPKYTKSQVLKMTGISSAQFNNWMFRGLVPKHDLGFELVNLTSAKYSILVIAYCHGLKYHRGQNRKLYISLLKQIFKQIENESFDHQIVIAIDDIGKGKDCMVFESYQTASKRLGSKCAIVPIGKIIKHYLDIPKNEYQGFI